MAADGDDPDVHQEVTAGRDAFVAGGDINANFYTPPAEIHPVERKLAQVVLQQAQDARSVLIGTDRPGSETANVEYAPMPGRLREADGRDIGDLRSVLEYYRSLSPPRLVIIGAPGAGKTVLLLELQIRLLMERRTDPKTEIPVLISASACDTTKKWDDWLAAHLSLRFSIPERTAADLITAHRILPIIDGLDEMDPTGTTINPERAQALVKSLNDSMRYRDRAPVVVTSRPGEYARLTEGIDKARHVELSALTGREAVSYLDGQFRTTAERDRWKPVLETLKGDPDGLLAAELSTPWRLTLALATFRTSGDPTQLLPPAGITDGAYSAHVDHMLLGSYVSTAVSLREEAAAPYTEPKVRHWLTSLADGLAWQTRQGRSATDITLHEWWHLRDTRVADIPYAILMLLPGFISLVIGGSTNYSPAVVSGIFVIIALGPSGTLSRHRTHNLHRITNQDRFTADLGSHPRMGSRLWLTVLMVLLSGLVFGSVFGLVWLTTRDSGHPFRYAGLAVLIFGLIFGFMFGSVLGPVLADISPKVRRPQATIRTNGLVGLAGGLVYGLAVGLLAGFTTSLMPKSAISALGWFTDWFTGGLTFGLTFGLTVWLAICHRIWIRYHLAVAWSALRGRGPLRFGRFLDWAVRAGLLRESGVSYQFRHRQLQDWFTG